MKTQTIGQSSSLRVYHFAATLVGVGVAIWVGFYATLILRTATNNFTQTQCNQGLLILATHDMWVEQKLALCDPKIYIALEEKYK